MRVRKLNESVKNAPANESFAVRHKMVIGYQNIIQLHLLLYQQNLIQEKKQKNLFLRMAKTQTGINIMILLNLKMNP